MIKVGDKNSWDGKTIHGIKLHRGTRQLHFVGFEAHITPTDAIEKFGERNHLGLLS